MARAICRRAERSVYPLIHAESVDAEVGRYLNRLSDFLFAATRAAALREGREELLWIKAVLPPSAASAATAAASVMATGSFDAAGMQPMKRTTGNAESTSIIDNGDSPFSVAGMDDEFFDPSHDSSVTAKSAAMPEKTMKMVGRDSSQSSDMFMNIEFFDPSSPESDTADQPIIAKNAATRGNPQS